jgi:hypothetical protein
MLLQARDKYHLYANKVLLHDDHQVVDDSITVSLEAIATDAYHIPIASHNQG